MKQVVPFSKAREPSLYGSKAVGLGDAARHGLAVLAPFRCALSQFEVLALHLCQCLFFQAKEARVLDFGAIREGGKGFETHINADFSAAKRSCC